ncbi:MAG: Rid family detoxifying hydrolase [Deltaproteobacteria bacterium]|jgi:2-iminobutanoate/2-iminopropanoate deaminase|nr:Rid family detoxifying hydrolase [Deltaproteobacteria bacterium]
MKKGIFTKDAPEAIGPYSQAIVSGGTIYVSGQLPIDADGKIPEGAVEQAVQSLKNIKAILEAAGSSMDKILKVSVFMTDLKDFIAVNEAYATFFGKPFPARVAIQAAALPRGVKVEIDAIAEL